MELSLTRTGDVLVVSFLERVNLEGDASVAFKDKLRSLVGTGHVQVVMDLGKVGFIDSQGLGALISCLKVLRQGNGNLALTNVSEPVEAVLRITRLIRVFDVYPSVDDAIAAFGPGRRPAMAGHGA